MAALTNNPPPSIKDYFLKYTQLDDILDIVYIKYGPSAAQALITQYNNIYTHDSSFSPHYIIHDLEFYTSLHPSSPLDWTKEDFVNKCKTIDKPCFRIASRVASIKYGPSLLDAMVAARNNFNAAAPPKYKHLFPLEDPVHLLNRCISTAF